MQSKEEQKEQQANGDSSGWRWRHSQQLISSDLSTQSRSPSHTHSAAMQRPSPQRCSFVRLQSREKGKMMKMGRKSVGNTVACAYSSGWRESTLIVSVPSLTFLGWLQPSSHVTFHQAKPHCPHSWGQTHLFLGAGALIVGMSGFPYLGGKKNLWLFQWVKWPEVSFEVPDAEGWSMCL